MQSKKTLLFGSNGFLGTTLLKYFSSDTLFAPTHDELDLLDSNAIYNFIEKKQPDNVIYAAGISKIDFAQKNTELTYELNTNIPKKITKFLANTKSQFIYLSTDAVFDGNKKNYHFNEDSKPNAESIYGLSKLKGEYFTQNANVNNVIIRLITLYGIHPTKSNFVTTMIDLLKIKKQFVGIIDQIQNPLYLETAAEGIHFINKNNLKGIYHLGALNEASNYDFLVSIAKQLELHTALIKGITFAEFMNGKQGHRKQKSVLLCKKFIQASKNTILLTLDQSVERFADSIKNTK